MEEPGLALVHLRNDTSSSTGLTNGVWVLILTSVVLDTVGHVDTLLSTHSWILECVNQIESTRVLGSVAEEEIVHLFEEESILGDLFYFGSSQLLVKVRNNSWGSRLSSGLGNGSCGNFISEEAVSGLIWVVLEDIRVIGWGDNVVGDVLVLGLVTIGLTTEDIISIEDE